MRAHPVVRLLRVAGILIALAVPAREGRAVTRAFYFQPLGGELGLTQNSVGAIAQDEAGFVWVGTQGGLHRYDGVRYRAFRHDPRDPRSLPDSFITALAADGHGGLWVGTYSQYVARLDLRSGSIRRFAAATADRRAGRQVLALRAEPQAIWIGTVAGLDRLDPETGRRTRVLALTGAHSTGAPNQQLLRDRAGRLWYATGDGLFRIGPRGAIRVSADQAYALVESGGSLWIGGAAGVRRLQGDRLVPAWPRPGTVEHFTEVRALAQAPDGRLWISAYPGGLRRFDPATGDVLAVHEMRDIPGSLPEDSINVLMVDRGGMLWVGGQYRGAAVADPRGSRFIYLTDPRVVSGPSAAANDSIRSVTGTPGAVWLGTDGDRLLRYDLARGAFADLTDRLPEPRGRVAGFAPSTGGRLWMATGTGLVELDPALKTMRPVDLGLPGRPALRSITPDRQGGLWLGTSGGGALHYLPGQGRVERLESGPGAGDLSHPNVHAVLVDRRGRVWFGTGDGLDMFDPSTRTMRHARHVVDRPDSLPGNVVRALYEDRDGRIWVGSHAGLSRFIEPDRRGAARPLSFEHPLDHALPGRHAPIIFSLGEAPRGVLWAGTDAGLLRYRASTRSARLFGLGDGLQDLEFNGGAVGRLSDGSLAFGGVRGVNLVDPQRAFDDAGAAPVRLLSARIGSGVQGDRGLWQPASLDLPAGADLLRLQVGALDFSPSADLRYRYRMEGFDRGWIDNGVQHDITYTHLPPGSYLLRVQSTDRSGGWSARELRLPVRVAMPWWRHPLVLLLAGIVLVAPLLFAGWQWRERRRRERDHVRTLGEREERLKLALWASGEQFWDYDLADGMMYRMLPRDPVGTAPGLLSEVIAEREHRIHPEDDAHVRRQMRRHMRGEIPVFESQHRVPGPDGGWIWVRARGRVVERDARGRALRIAGTARDITSTRRAERERRVASEVLRSMAEAVAVFDDDFHFISVNPAFTRMTGYTEREVVGQSTSLVDSRQHDASVYHRMRDELRAEGRWYGELWQQRKDGSEFLCLLQASVVLDNAGQRGHWVAVLSDITDQKRAEQELRYLANYDVLTGLPNRALLSERLSRAIVRARRNGSRIGLLFLDLDRFKDINDSLGHAAGDAILRATAGRLQHAVGGQHVVARLGGDEFTVVIENLEHAEQAEELARELLVAFEQPLDAGDLRDITISPSIGIALYPDHAETPSDLLKHADTAMYQAKAIGRRTFTRYTGTMDADVRRRATLSAALRKVLDRDELRLVYQPKMSVTGQRLTGVEALLRWNSGEFGAVSPVQFIPLAEESGLILEIGEWALRSACGQLAQWRARGVELTMAVNVSALQLRRGNLAEVIEHVLQATGLPAACLELELTESVVMAEETWAALHAIRALGVRMAIDDFGTGYSSLAYLKRLPITTLKIDREFIADLTRDPDDEAITSAVIVMGHSLGLNVVAEGVETAGQLDFLRRHGVDEIQGYWLAHPMEADACLAFLEEWSQRSTTGIADAIL